MLTESVTAFMIASLALGQTPMPATSPAPQTSQSSPAQSGPASGQPAPATDGQPSPTSTGQTVTVPAGTAIQMTLMSTMKSKSTKAGDSIRAVVAFPVTIGMQLAIPAGTFVDGTVIRVTSQANRGQQNSFSAHFTRLVFSNGYSVALNGENVQALLMPTEESARTLEVAELVPPQLPGMHFAMGEGQVGLPPTQAPPPPRVGPNPAVVTGAVLGGVAAFVILGVTLGHHRIGNADSVLYAAGWQFQMVLDSPVTLDAAQISAAAAIPGGY